MTLNKAIEYGREHRKEYRDAKACDVTCRNHGGCVLCEGNRTYSKRGAETMYDEKIEEFAVRRYTNGENNEKGHGDDSNMVDCATGEHTVEFVSYDGRYPNLCSGTLVLRIDGEDVVFEDSLASGGYVSFDEDWDEYIDYGPWIVNVPGEYKSIADKISECVNENVEWGCCGGCI